MRVVPCTRDHANAYIKLMHRHSGRVVGHLFACAVIDEHALVHGVAMTGRPIARFLQDGATAEVLRVCTDGTFNACSMLYSASWRAAKALGYWRMITYIRAHELGTSLKASGWREVGATQGGSSWGSSERHRDTERMETVRWEITAGDPVPTVVWPDVGTPQLDLFAEET